MGHGEGCTCDLDSTEGVVADLKVNCFMNNIYTWRTDCTPWFLNRYVWGQDIFIDKSPKSKRSKGSLEIFDSLPVNETKKSNLENYVGTKDFKVWIVDIKRVRKKLFKEAKIKIRWDKSIITRRGGYQGKESRSDIERTWVLYGNWPCLALSVRELTVFGTVCSGGGVFALLDNRKPLPSIEVTKECYGPKRIETKGKLIESR